jgi:protein-S-isoprenylcysteine O-methyltransferase Ste14
MGSTAPLLVDFWIWVVLLVYWFASAPFTHKTKQRATWMQQVQHATPFYLALCLIFAKRNFGPLDYPMYTNNSIGWLGTFMTGAGIAFAFWARITIGRNWDGYVTLKHGHRLIRTGPYT